MKKTIYLMAFLVTTVVEAQVELSFSVGYGSYSLADIREYQNFIKTSFPVSDAKVTDEFPSYYLYQISGKTPVSESAMIGLTISYGSTGGRVSYSDYSGMLLAEQLLNYYEITLSAGPYFSLPHNFMLFVDFKPGITITKLELTGSQSIQTFKSTESNLFRSINIGFQPTLSLSKRVGYIGASVFASYQATIVNGKLKFIENKDLYLVDNRSQEVYAIWDGVRFGLGISCYFGILKK